MDKTSGYRHSLLEKLTKSRQPGGSRSRQLGRVWLLFDAVVKTRVEVSLAEPKPTFFLVWSRNQTFDTAPAPASVLKYVHISHVKFDSYSLSHEAFDPGLEAEDTFPHPSADLLHFKKTFSVSPSPSFMSF